VAGGVALLGKVDHAPPNTVCRRRQFDDAVDPLIRRGRAGDERPPCSVRAIAPFPSSASSCWWLVEQSSPAPRSGGRQRDPRSFAAVSEPPDDRAALRQAVQSARYAARSSVQSASAHRRATVAASRRRSGRDRRRTKRLRDVGRHPQLPSMTIEADASNGAAGGRLGPITRSSVDFAEPFVRQGPSPRP